MCGHGERAMSAASVLEAKRANDLRLPARRRRVGRICDADLHHRYRRAQRSGDGFRYANAPGVHGRDDEPGRFAERDLTQ